MEIGSIINIRIDGKDKVCILLSKKTWLELNSGWPKYGQDIDDTLVGRTFIFEAYNGGNPPTLYSYFQRRGATFLNIHDSEICYELMMGDRKVWMRDKQFREHKKEV